MKTFVAALLTLALAAGFVSCGSSEGSPDAATVQPGADATAQPGLDATTQPGLDAAWTPDSCPCQPPDASLPGLDAGQPGLDAATPPGKDAGPVVGPDAFVPLDYDAGPKPCSFNTDCPPNERCYDPNFVCMIGPRGDGKTGVDHCTNGNDCQGAVCTEGWPSGTYYCSGECGGDAGTCSGQLTVCMYIPFVGDTCVRNLDGGT